VAGWIQQTRDTIVLHDRRLEQIERKLGIDARGLAAEAAGSGSLSSAVSSWLTHASQEDLAYVLITGGPSGDGYFTARRQMPTPARTVIDDDELTDTLKVYPVGGATPFKGAAGFVRYSGLIGSPAEPLWLTLVGEWSGFLAKLTDAPDASESYAWQQVGTAPFTTPLTHAFGSPTPLGRALDYSFRSKDPDIPSSARANFAANTVVPLRWDPVASRMFFFGRREPLSELC